MSSLTKPVLVLNKSWLPVNTISVEKAINMLFSCYANGEPKAKIIEAENFSQLTWSDWSKLRPKEGEDYIAGANYFLKVPEVILLTRYNKLPKTKANFSRKEIFKRDNYTCQVCSKKVDGFTGSIDHLIPKSRSGKTEWTNCCVMCVPCNGKKANRTLEEAGMKLLKIPIKPKLNFFRNEIKPLKSWENFISEVYWNTELQN